MGILPLPYSERIDAINDLLDGFIKLNGGMPQAVTLANIAVSGSASDLFSGTLADARLSSNVVLRNISNVFTTGNTFQATQVFDASIVVGGLIGPRIRNVGQVFRLNTNDDTARAGLEVGNVTSTGNIEVSTGLVAINTTPQTWRSLAIIPVNNGDRSGVRINDYGSLASAVNQSAFEVAYLGGTPTSPSTPVSGHYRNLLVFRTGGTNGLLSSSPGFAIRSTIGAVIGSSLSMVDTSFVVTPTGTGVPISAQTIYGNTGLVDFPVGQIQLGTNVRLKNVSGVLQARNSGDTDYAQFRADYFRFKDGSYLISDATYTYSVDNLDAVKPFRAKTFTASSGDMFLSVFGDKIVSSTSGQPWTLLTNSNTALGIKVGNLVVSDSYSDVAPTNGLFVKGNSNFTGTVTSAFQTLSSDPSTIDIGTGLSRLVKNTTSGKIAKFVNDGGTIKEAGVSNAQIVVAPTGTTATITMVNSASQTLDLSSATGTVAVTLTTPGIVSKGSIVVKQGATVRDFNVSVSSGTLQWIGYETDWATMAASSSSAFGWIYDGSVTYLFAADSSAGVAWGDITGKPNPITNIANGKLSFRIDGGGVAPTTGAKKVFFPVPYNCTITGWELVADVSGSIVVDIWKDTYANYAPTNADSITASAKPTLSSAIKANSTTLTGWTTTLNAGDYIELEVESASTLTVVVLTLTVTKT